MSKRKTDVGNSLNIVKDAIRFYREKNNYFYEHLSDLLMLHGIDINKQEIYKIDFYINTLLNNFP